jgi:hypothetical protein
MLLDRRRAHQHAVEHRKRALTRCYHRVPIQAEFRHVHLGPVAILAGPTLPNESRRSPNAPEPACVPRGKRPKWQLRVENFTIAPPRAGDIMTKDELTTWALANGWRMMAGFPSLTRPNRPADAIVRLALKATVVNLEIKKPAGKWEKVASAAYSKLEPDPETGLPRGLGLDTISGLSMLMQDNKNRAVFG